MLIMKKEYIFSVYKEVDGYSIICDNYQGIQTDANNENEIKKHIKEVVEVSQGFYFPPETDKIPKGFIKKMIATINKSNKVTVKNYDSKRFNREQIQGNKEK